VKEEFIVYLWKNRLLQPDLYTTTGEAVSILHPGVENHDAGPDFMVARVRIGQTLWAGNVEIHVRASDWLKHRHEQDAAYDNIILHVVFICDKDIADKMGEHIPVLEVKDFFDRDLYEKYQQLKRSEKNIPCEAHIAGTDRFLLSHWLNRLLIERLEQKNREIIAYLDYFNNNREQVLYYFLARNFGFGINSMAFGLLAQRTPLPLLKKKKEINCLSWKPFCLDRLAYWMIHSKGNTRKPLEPSTACTRSYMRFNLSTDLFGALPACDHKAFLLYALHSLLCYCIQGRICLHKSYRAMTSVITGNFDWAPLPIGKHIIILMHKLQKNQKYWAVKPSKTY
jgi:hypothetical protein